MLETEKPTLPQPKYYESVAMAESQATSTSISDNAVVLKNVSKTYKTCRSTYEILKNLNLHVPSGTICGLLGPSGCGKTTILKCILGRLSTDGGTISVFGESPKAYRNATAKHTVGYMPQDIALLDKLTVKETLYFFGAISGLSKKAAKQRSEFLMTFLHIPFTNQKIFELSGGQRRRTSFAVALLHEPELLILDEPTVGVDPALRKSIWEHLILLTSSTNTTIIISTHYIEEARMAQSVGLTLEGQVLIQAPPDLLMQQYNCSTLESVFLKLCIQFQKRGSLPHNSQEYIKNDQMAACSQSDVQMPTILNEKQTSSVNKEKRTSSQRMSHTFLMPQWHRITALTAKNIKTFLNYPFFFILQLILPSSLTFVFGGLIGKPLYGLAIGVVNNDSRNLGNLFLDKINHRILLLEMYYNYEVATADVDRGKIWNAIYLGPNFTEAFINRMRTAALVDNMTLEQSIITLYSDTSNQYVYLSILSELRNAFNSFTQDVMRSLKLNHLFGGIPITYMENQVYGKMDVSYDQFVIPPFFLSVTFFLAMTFTSLLLLLERAVGSYERMLITGVKSVELIASHIVSQLILLTCQVIIMLFSAFVILGYTCEGSYVLIVLLSILQGLCGMSFGMLFSTLVDNPVLAIFGALGLYFLTIFTEGMVWPTQGMPEIFQILTLAGPQTYAGEAMRSIINRGWGIDHPAVYMGFIVTFVWIVVTVLLSCIIARIRE